MSKKKTESKAVWKNLLAGGFAGGFEATLMYPTEYVKTQLQLQAADVKKGGTARFSGIGNCFQQTVKTKGFFGLYSGCTTLIFGSIPKAAVRFAAFQQFKSILQKPDGTMTPPMTMLCGMLAGFGEAILAVTPVETVKTKLVHDSNSANPKYRGLIHGVSTMIKTDGIASIYKGLVPTMAKQGANQATRFTIFSALKDLLQGPEKKALHPAVSFAAGSTAGAVSVYATMPFDVVKTQMQGLEAAQYKNSFHCGYTVAKEGGVQALWKGTLPRLGRVMFSGGIIFAVYEQAIAQILYVAPDY